jgi:hypothetical protein
MPSQKDGTVRPSTAPMRSTMSALRPRRLAMMQPSGTAAPAPITSARKVSSSVGQILARISSATGRPVQSEAPKSP